MKLCRPVLLGMLACAAACQPTGRPSASGPPGTKAAQSVPVADLPGEALTWDQILMHGKPVGYQSLQLSRQSDPESAWLIGAAESELVVLRFGELTRQKIQLVCRQSEDGQQLLLESNISLGADQQRTLGRRDGDQLRMEARTAAATQQWSLPIPPGCGGYFAVEWSLKLQPMHPGELRQLHAIVPILNQVAEIRLQAQDSPTVDRLPAPSDLTRIHQQLTLADGHQIDSLLWVDASGQIIRSEVPSLHQVSQRVDRATALSAADGPGFDLGEFSRIPLDQPIRNANTTRRVQYRVRQRTGDPSRMLLNTSSQSVMPAGSDTAVVTVRARRAGQEGVEEDRMSATDSPRAADLGPSALIQSDAPEVVELARQIRPMEDGPWSTAVAIERFVFELLTDKNFSTAFATAAEVARSRQGDCTEHAVLTAALCRAHGIPARVLFGLVYVNSPPSFSFHMWNAVWIDGIWIPLDATIGQGGIGATHLVLGQTSLASPDGLASLLPILGGMGEWEIDVITAEY